MATMNLTERDKRALVAELNEWNLRKCIAICETERNRKSKWWGAVWWVMRELARVESPNEDIEKARGECLPGDAGNTRRKNRSEKWTAARRKSYEKKWGARPETA